MTRSYRPSNGTEGMDFMDKFCLRCERDRKFRETQDGEDGCPIVADTFVYETDDHRYPKEWICEEDFSEARCTAFEEAKP